jgi:ketosteroid isomerase-like protein
VVLIVLRARGRGTGIEVQNRGVHLWRMRDGKAVRLEGYFDREAGLRSVGLQG